MIYQGHLEPLRFTIHGQRYNEETKQLCSYDKMIINRTRLGIKWPNTYTLLAFERGGVYTDAAYMQIFKELSKMEHPKEFTEHVTIAQIDRGAKDLSSLVIHGSDGFANHIIGKLSGSTKTVFIKLVYYRSKSANGEYHPFFDLVDTINSIVKESTNNQQELKTFIQYQEAFEPDVFVEEITDTIEL